METGMLKKEQVGIDEQGRGPEPGYHRWPWPGYHHWPLPLAPSPEGRNEDASAVHPAGDGQSLPAAEGVDPIQRLSDELAAVQDELESLTKRVACLEARPVPAVLWHDLAVRLTSRKLWLTIAANVGLIIATLPKAGLPPSLTAELCAGLTAFYALVEGWRDANAAKP